MDLTLAKKLKPGDAVLIHGETTAAIKDKQGFDGELYWFDVDVPGWHGLPPYSNEGIEPLSKSYAEEWMKREDQR